MHPDPPGSDPSPNGRHPQSSWTQLRVDRASPGYCRVTFDHPPANTVTAATAGELAELLGLIEADQELSVVVFDSANPDFYLMHDDPEHDHQPAGPAWPDVLTRMSRAPVVSVASVRGRTRGAGTEFVLACDLRFASRENTLLGPVGRGAAHRSDTIGRLAGLAGRGRALEVLLTAADLDAARAEQYGVVNRLIPDDRLDDEVAGIAARIARVDRVALRRLKFQVDRATLPDDGERLPPA